MFCVIVGSWNCTIYVILTLTKVGCKKFVDSILGHKQTDIKVLSCAVLLDPDTFAILN